MIFSPETALAVATFVGGVGIALNRLGWLKLGKNGKCLKKECPDADCQSTVTQTHHDVGVLQKSQDKVVTAIFGEDGTEGMVKTMHRTEFIVESLAKAKGIDISTK